MDEGQPGRQRGAERWRESEKERGGGGREIEREEGREGERERESERGKERRKERR